MSLKGSDLWPFVGRTDVFAHQFSDGHYEPVRIPLTEEYLDEHLAGFASYGSYVMNTDDTVNFMVFDLDTYSPEAYEWLVICLTQFCGIVGARSDHLLMENSGGKGFHAWLFFDSPLPAAQVRAWARRDFLPRWQEQADAFDGTPLEIFPKQDRLSGEGFGNLVKLPFGVHAKSGRRSTLVPIQGWAEGVDSIRPLNANLVPAWSPEDALALAGRPSGTFLPDLPCERQLLEKGCSEGNRNITMRWLAHRLLGTGWLSLAEVMAACSRLNEELFHPPLTRRELEGAVGAANAAEAPHPSCHGKNKSECPGGPLCTADWNDRTVGKSWKAKEPDSTFTLTPRSAR